MSRILIEGFALGLSTGTFCLISCAPFFVPYLMGEGNTKIARNLKLIAEFLAGRLSAYILFALIVSSIGISTSLQIPPQALKVAVKLTAILLILYSFPLNFPRLEICRIAQNYIPYAKFPFILGFLIGINLCPPFIAALLQLIALGSIFKSLLFFLAFFAGTTLYTLPLLFFSALNRWQRIKNIGQIASLITGIYYLLK